MHTTRTIGALVGLLLFTVAAGQEPLRIAIEGAYPPFSYIDANGQPGGFDIDIANALCAAIQTECQLIEQSWDGLIPGLLAKRYDAIIASMSITAERKKRVDFTNKYYSTPSRFVRKKGSGIEISPVGLQDKTIGVQRSTVQDRFLTDNFGAVANIRRYASAEQMYPGAVRGQVDLLFGEAVVLLEFLQSPAGEEFELTGPAFSDPEWFGEGIGIAVRKGDTALRTAFNEAIDTLRANGKYQEIQDKYFDFDIYGE